MEREKDTETKLWQMILEKILTLKEKSHVQYIVEKNNEI